MTGDVFEYAEHVAEQWRCTEPPYVLRTCALEFWVFHESGLGGSVSLVVRPRPQHVTVPNPGSRQDAIVIGVLTLPFLLNDFANIFVHDYRVWLAIDYGFVKAFPLAVVFYLLRAERISYSDLGLRRIGFARFVIWSFIMTVVGIFIDQFGSRFFAMLLPDTRLGGMPPITNPLIAQIDLYLGLALVAIVEELIFRGLYCAILARYISSGIVVLMISAVAFGLIHWSLGLSAIVHTAIIGAVFMICIWRTGSVFPTIVAHFFVNYVAFSGLLGKL